MVSDTSCNVLLCIQSQGGGGGVTGMQSKMEEVKNKVLAQGEKQKQ